jgi:hypothetical protein
MTQPRLILPSPRLSYNDAVMNSEDGVAKNFTGVGNNGREHHAQCHY